MVPLTPLVQRALNTAARLHNGQYRRAGHDLPYISHCFSVAWLVAAYGGSETAVVAALLHDVLEDVSNYTFTDLERDFGTAVADVVMVLSEQDVKTGQARLPWEKRKALYLENLKVAEREALIVSAADKIHNLRSLADAYRQEGEAVWKLFHASSGDKLWFYSAVLEILRDRLDSPIVDELEEVYTQTRELMGLK